MKRLWLATTAALAAMIGAVPAMAQGDAVQKVTVALAGDRGCTFQSWDGGTDARGHNERLLTTYDCGAAGYMAVLSEGEYPVHNDAKIADYRVLVRQRIAKSRGAQLDLVDGVCRIGRKSITGTGVLVANWRGRLSVSGAGIVALWMMSPNRSTLLRKPTKGMICEMDEP